MFGSLLNVDGARGESNAIVLTKQPGRNTQMRHLILNLQTASERFRRDVILKCYKDMFKCRNDDDDDDDDDDNDSVDGDGNNEMNNPKQPCGSRFEVIFQYDQKSIRTKWTSSKMKGKQCIFPRKVNDAVFDKLGFYNGGHAGKRIISVQGFTELKFKLAEDILDDTSSSGSTTNSNNSNDSTSKHSTVRACPSFRMSRPWFDWVTIRWTSSSATDDGDEGDSDSDGSSLERQDIEAQVLMMLDMTTVDFEDSPPPNNNNRVLTNTPHDPIQALQVAFVHSAKVEMTNKSNTGRISAVASWMEMEDQYQMVELECIHGPCFVTVDTMNNTNNGRFVAGEATKIISLLPKHRWCQKFLDYDDIDLKEIAGLQRDNEVTEEDLKPYES